MSIDSFYILLLCFISGFTQCALTGCSLFMLKHHHNYQFQRVFAAVVLLHSIGFFNNFVVLACRHLPYSEFLNSLLVLFDYLIVGGYMMFVVTLVFPNRYKTGQLFLFEIPYVAAMLLFSFIRSPWILTAVQIYTLVLSTFLLIYLVYSIKKHTEMLRNNVGNMEYFDLRWSGFLIGFFFVFQLFWAIESVSQQSWFSATSPKNNLLFDSAYCLLTIAIVVFVMKKIIKQQVFTLSPISSVSGNRNSLIFVDLEKTIREKKYFQDNTLTLQKLAQHLGTNRQYLSNHINQELHTTFYDYINEFRLVEAKAMIDDKDTEHQHSFEEIASMAGFNSYATFLRSFKKKFGQTPSQYLAETSKGN